MKNTETYKAAGATGAAAEPFTVAEYVKDCRELDGMTADQARNQLAHYVRCGRIVKA